MAENEEQENDKQIEKVPVERHARALSPFEEMDRMLENFFPRRWMQPFRWDVPRFPELAELKMPKVDIIDRDKEIVVRAELPGVEKEDIDVSMTDNSVTIKGSTSHEEKEEQGNYFRCEISRGSFSRTVSLPGDVDPDNTKASYKDGILELIIPKVERSHRKSITVE